MKDKTLRVPPAMQSDFIKRIMSIEDIVNLVQIESLKKRGGYYQNFLKLESKL